MGAPLAEPGGSKGRRARITTHISPGSLVPAERYRRPPRCGLVVWVVVWGVLGGALRGGLADMFRTDHFCVSHPSTPRKKKSRFFSLFTSYFPCPLPHVMGRDGLQYVDAQNLKQAIRRALKHANSYVRVTSDEQAEKKSRDASPQVGSPRTGVASAQNCTFGCSAARASCFLLQALIPLTSGGVPGPSSTREDSEIT